MNHPESLWSQTVTDSIQSRILPGHFDTDVVIIGGGYTGLSTSYFLQKMGYQTVVLDEKVVGWGASGRNAGMLIPGYKMHINAITKKWGIEAAKDMLQLTTDSIELIKQIVEEWNIDCSLTNCGSIGAAFKKQHLERFKRNQEFMEKQFGYQTWLLEGTEMEKELYSDCYQGVLVDPHGYSFHPLNYAIGLAKAVQRLGGEIFEHTKAIKIESNQKEVRVITDKGLVKASHIVIASNGYTYEVTPNLKKSIVPIGSFMLATETLDESVANRLIPNQRVVSDSKNFLNYFRLTPDRRLLFGGRVDFSGTETPELYEKMAQSMISVFPDLSEVNVEYRWGGLVAMTLDQLPHIGTTKEGYYYAVGYSGRGAAISTILGKLLALNIKGDLRELNWLENMPLKRIPFHSQRNIGLNLVGAYYTLKDKYF